MADEQNTDESATAAAMQDARAPAISVVIPMFNEAPNVAALEEKLKVSLSALERTWEVIFVDDGSSDDTAKLLDQVVDRDRRFSCIHFRRNFGQTAAMSAGFRHARGKIVIPMDGDLQNDPGDIGKLIEKIEEGFDVVSGWRKSRKDPLTKKIPLRFANALISMVSGVRLHDYGCSLKAYRREVLADVYLYGEMHRFIPIYASIRGARVTEVPVAHHPRTAGKSKYGLERTLKVLLDLMVVKFFSSFINKPIYLFGSFGLLFMLLSFISFLVALTFKLIPPDNPWGPAWHKDFVQTPLPQLATILFVLAIMTILQGILAELIMRTYYESQHKDPFVIRYIHTQADKE